MLPALSILLARLPLASCAVFVFCGTLHPCRIGFRWGLANTAGRQFFGLRIDDIHRFCLRRSGDGPTTGDMIFATIGRDHHFLREPHDGCTA